MFVLCESTSLNPLVNTAIAVFVVIVVLKLLLLLILPKRGRFRRPHQSKSRGKSIGSLKDVIVFCLLAIVSLTVLTALFPRFLWFLAIFTLLGAAAGLACVAISIQRRRECPGEMESNQVHEPEITESENGCDSATYRGDEGEDITSSILDLLGNGYHVLNNVMLPIENEGTTQIDHIVVSEYGIFVIETKNYSGWIFADSESRVWTQSLRGPNRSSVKHTFQNPIRQNYRHICALAENLGISKRYFISIVVFVGRATFKTDIPDGVTFGHQLLNYIKSFSTPIIKASQLIEVAEVIKQWEDTLSDEERSSHVERLKQRHNSALKIS